MNLYADGGSRGNPGPAAAGYMLKTGNKLIAWNGVFLGNKTNNYAEYQAVLLGVYAAIENRAKTLHIFTDSSLVKGHLTEGWKVRNPELIKIKEDISKLIEEFFPMYSVNLIPREENQVADFIVNITLEQNRNAL